MAAAILCVDNDRNLSQILKKALTGEGYLVRLAHDGDQALKAFREAPPDLLLLDVLLPLQDGFEVLAEIRALDPPEGQTPVLLMTGCRVTDQYQTRARDLGSATILAKPVPLEVLLREVGRHLKEGPPQVEASPVAARPEKKLRAGESLKGNFSKELSLPHLLHHLHGLRATGVLMLANGKKRKAVQMRDGYPVAVKSNLVNECLGNQLLRSGAIGPDELAESIQRLRKGEGLQGQILVAMELMTAEEVAAALREQAQEKLFEVFEWKRGSFRFEIGGRLKRGNELALEGSPANLILEGVRRRVPIERIDDFLRSKADHFALPGESPFYRLQEIDLSASEREVLSKLDGSQQLKDFLDAEEEVRRILFGLLIAEILDLREARGAGTIGESADGARLEVIADEPDPPEEGGSERRSRSSEDRQLRAELAATAENLRGLSYFEMLGVSEKDGDGEVAAAYEQLAKRHHPDRYSSASNAVRQLADEVYQLVSRAQEVLTDPRGRKEYLLERRKGERQAAEREEGKRALEAEIVFQKGEARIRAREYEQALRYFGSALEKFPEDGEYHAHYGWCLHLCYPDDASMAQEAIEHVKRGVKLARDREKPYLFLGRLFKVVGKNSSAERMFTRAVQIRPDCVEALRELRLINLRREKRKGLVGRLLRR
jgi:CheY-like chemotaxis protein/tetratricopeptide (TPR) repeat protein